MKKYKLKKDLPCLKAWEILYYKESAWLWYIEDENKFLNVNIESVTEEWFEEIIEWPKFKIWDYAVSTNHKDSPFYIKLVDIRELRETYYVYNSTSYGDYFEEKNLRKPTEEELKKYFR